MPGRSRVPMYGLLANAAFCYYTLVVRVLPTREQLQGPLGPSLQVRASRIPPHAPLCRAGRAL
jgi:hypothetical protein